MEIRRLCLLPLDDLVAVTKEFINADTSRSGISRLLRREGLSKLADLEPKAQGEETSKKTFKDYEPGFVHMDIKYLPQMPDEQKRSHLFVAIDRATRWVFLRVYADQKEASAVDFLRRVHAAAAFKITKLLTDNGAQFTDRFTNKERQVSGSDAFTNTSRNVRWGMCLLWMRSKTGARKNQHCLSSKFINRRNLTAELNRWQVLHFRFESPKSYVKQMRFNGGVKLH